MKKILLVDDDPLSVEFMRLFMEADGHEVWCACSCSEARSLYDEHRPEVLVTDVELLDGSGVDLAQYVKGKGIPVIVGVTGHSREHLKESGNDVSVFNSLLTKPIELDVLKRAIQPK